MPFESVFIHQIYTDDEVWLEQFWHQRFALKRRNGEWFELSDEEVNEFILHKAMKKPSGIQLTIDPLLEQQEQIAKIDELESSNRSLNEEVRRLEVSNRNLQNELTRMETEIRKLKSEQVKVNDAKKITYVGTWNRQLFHRPNCKWLESVPQSALRHFASHEEAVEAGYKPCKTCCS